MARRSNGTLRFHVRESETPGPERVQRGLALWGEFLLRHLAAPGEQDEQTDQLAEVR